MKRTKKLTALALTISFALILSYIESRIPPFAPIPGIKVGLANIAVIFTLYKFGAKEAIVVSVLRVLLVSMLFGTKVFHIVKPISKVFIFCTKYLPKVLVLKFYISLEKEFS